MSILLVVTCEQALKADGTFGDPATCEMCLTKVARSGDIHRHMLSHFPAEEKALFEVSVHFDRFVFLSLLAPMM